MKGFEHTTGTFIGKGAIEIFFQTWTAPKPKTSLVIIHGMGEHSGRYMNLVGSLAGAGISIYAYDLRGHGKSGGKRGHVWSFSEYTADLGIFLDIVEGDNGGLPVALLGHSLGGLIALSYSLDHQERLAGLMASSPFLQLAMKVPAWKTFTGRLLSGIFPSFSMPTGLNPADISHDRDAVEAYENDPLVHGRATSRWFTEAMTAQEKCLERAGELTLPVFIFHGSDDRIAAAEGSRLLHGRVSSQKKELMIFEGLYHETMNETAPRRNPVLAQVKKWALSLSSRRKVSRPAKSPAAGARKKPPAKKRR